jgi:hypothetical protein
LDLVLTKHGANLIRLQRYDYHIQQLIIWRRLLSVALSCFEQNKKQQYFFPRKRKEKNEKRKKDMPFSQQWSGGCQGFLEKYYPKRSEGVDIFSKTRRA